jgi:alpha-L-fucosidase
MINRRRHAMLAVLALTVGCATSTRPWRAWCALAAEDPQQAKVLPARPESLEKWRRMRFGMFIHWGPVSLTGREIGWSRGNPTPREVYDNLYKRFNPTKFDARDWVATAKAAGMKYIVLTTKHHDGFCLWDSQYTDYDIMSTPFKRDVVKELTDECKRQGVAFGPYYSILDWYQPDYGESRGIGPGYTLDRKPDLDKYVAYMKNQLRELNTRYGPFLVFWFDGEWEKPWSPQRGIDLNNFCRRLQPDVLVNNRVGKGRQGMEGVTKAGLFAGDFDTPEQRVGTFNREVPWETCMTICTQWAWKPDDRLKSLQECLDVLVSTAGGDGNLLLNVGPMPDGRIEPRQVERLEQIGSWLKKYGESIYATRGGPFKPGKWGASTCRENTVYLHVLNWPGDKLVLPAIDKKITAGRLLAGGRLSLNQTAEGITISVPVADRQPIDTIVVLTLDGNALEIPPIVVK